MLGHLQRYKKFCMESTTDIKNKLTVYLPALRKWVEETVAQHKHLSEAVPVYLFPQLSSCFNSTTLTQTRVVKTDRLPIPPLSKLGLSKLADFEHAGATGYHAITLLDTYFIRPEFFNEEQVHFHELIHIIQWKYLEVDKFLLSYGIGLLQHGYWQSPLEVMARRLTEEWCSSKDKPAKPHPVPSIEQQVYALLEKDFLPYLQQFP